MKKYKFIATTTEGRQVNVVYIGRGAGNTATRSVYNRLEKKHGVHPGRVQELLLINRS